MIFPSSQHTERISLKSPISVATATCLLASILTFAMVRLQSPAPALAPLITIATLFMAIKLPGAVFALYLLIPFYKGAVQPLFPIDITPVLAVICTLLALSYAWSAQSSNQGLVRQALLVWSLLTIVFIIGIAFSPDPSNAMLEVGSFILIVFFPCLLALRVGQNRVLLQQFIWATLGVALISTWVGFLALGSLAGGERLEILGSNTIGAGRAAILVPLLGACVISLAPRLLQVLLLISTPVALLVAIGSGSRAPLLMGLLTIVFVQLVVRKGQSKRIVVFALLFPLLLVGLQLPTVQERLPSASVERLQSSLDAFLGANDSEGLDDSAETRTVLWEFAWNSFQASPVIGNGTSSYVYQIQQVPGLNEVPYPHNLFLHMASEYGFVGLAVLLAFLSLALRNGLSTINDPWCAAVASLAVFALLSSQVSNGLFDNRWLWGSLIVLLMLPGAQLLKRRPVDVKLDRTMFETKLSDT